MPKNVSSMFVNSDALRLFKVLTEDEIHIVWGREPKIACTDKPQRNVGESDPMKLLNTQVSLQH